jgi:hypothetical protein
MGSINKIGIVIFALLLFSCYSQQIKTPPDMIIEYGYGLDTPGFDIIIKEIKPAPFSWAYSTITGTTHMVADSFHPLDNLNIPLKIGKTNKVKINILYPSDYYIVRYWPKSCIGDPDAYEQYFQTIDVNNDIIILPKEETEYIFEVKAVWESVNGIKGIKGDANYVFYYSLE